MSYDYHSEGFRDPILVWAGQYKTEYIHLYIWKHKDKASYALDVRAGDITLELSVKERLWLVTRILCEMCATQSQKSGESLKLKDRLTAMLEEQNGP